MPKKEESSLWSQTKVTAQKWRLPFPIPVSFSQFHLAFKERAVVRLLKALFVSGGYGNDIEELGKESRLPLKANKIDDCSVFLMGLSVLSISANKVKRIRTVQRRNFLAFINKAIEVVR